MPGAIIVAHLLGRELALWRGADGRAHAWENRCPRRGTCLSIGRISGDGIVCAYAVTPRFAATSTERQLELAGRLLDEHPGVRMQTHIAENHDEIRWVAELFPWSGRYLDVYARFGLLRPGALFGHCIHFDAEDWARFAAPGAVPCPGRTRRWGTLISAGPGLDGEAGRELLAACRGVGVDKAALAGVTRLPGVLIARWLGDSAEDARAYFAAVWAQLRPALKKVPALSPRIWAT